MSRSNRGVPLPAQSNKVSYYIESPKVNEALRGVILDDVYTGFYTHWLGRPVPCTRDKECRYHRFCGIRWTGYVAWWNLLANKRRILQLSEAAARDLKGLMMETGTLRGLEIETTRVDNGEKNGRMMVKLVGCVAPEKVPETHDIHDSLARLWGVNEEWMWNNGGPERYADRRFMKAGQAPLPPDDFAADVTKPTPEQRRHLRSIMGGFGGMPA